MELEISLWMPSADVSLSQIKEAEWERYEKWVEEGSMLSNEVPAIQLYSTGRSVRCSHRFGILLQGRFCKMFLLYNRKRKNESYIE